MAPIENPPAVAAADGDRRVSGVGSSWVRAFFDEITDETCFLCLLSPDAGYNGNGHKNKIARDGETANLERHLEGSFHASAMKYYNDQVNEGKSRAAAATATIERARAAADAGSIDRFTKKAKTYNASEEALMRELAMLSFVVEKGLSFNALESDFLVLYADLGGQARPPNRRRASQTLLPLLHALVVGRQKKLFANVDYFSITTDGWTGAGNSQYIALTAHFVDRVNWTLEVCRFVCACCK